MLNIRVPGATLLTALVLSLPSSALGSSFLDTTFLTADWTVTDLSSPGVTNTVQQTATGNPDTGRETLAVWVPVLSGTSLAHTLQHVNTLFTYDPSLSGAIGALTISFDAISLRAAFPSFTSFPYRALLIQGGVTYNTNEVLFTGTDWTTLVFNASSATLWDVAGTATGSPDFSATGQPITFGYRTGMTISCPGGFPGLSCGTYEGLDVVDNFRVTIKPQAVPEPTSVLLLGTALAGLCVRRRRS